MTFERLGSAAHDLQCQIDDQVKQLTRWAKPYTKQMARWSDDLRPFGRQAAHLMRKHPGKTAIGALVFGYLLSRFTRR